MTLYQSIPSFPPLIQFSPSEMGSSSSWKWVLYDLLLGGADDRRSGTTIVTSRFGILPTGMRATSLRAASSTTDTSFDPALLT